MVNTQKDGMIDFGACVRSYVERNINLQPQRLLIRLPNAKYVLNAGLKYFMGDSYTWLPEYDEVADWLTDNKGGCSVWVTAVGERPLSACKYCHVSCSIISIE